MAVDTSSAVYVADCSMVRKIDSMGYVTTLAGRYQVKGTADGVGTFATFVSATGVAVDSLGNVYVTDMEAHTIRMISPSLVVTTLAGSSFGAGYVDGYAGTGTGTSVMFSSPRGIVVGADLALYVSDSNNFAMRKVVLSGGDRACGGKIIP